MNRRKLYIALALASFLAVRETGILPLHLTYSSSDSVSNWAEVPAVEGFSERAVVLHVSRDGESLGTYRRDGEQPVLELNAQVGSLRLGALRWLPLWKPFQAYCQCSVTYPDGTPFGVWHRRANHRVIGVCSAHHAGEVARESLDQRVGPGILSMLSHEPVASVPLPDGNWLFP
ncbi:MAG: hypothetical protein ACYS26_06380 [Planctomycetota bacterium]|jgi:hypothetical protein